MTQISFFHGARDRLQAAAQWVNTAYSQNTSVLIYAPDEAHANIIDRLLWTQPALGFTPHCRVGDALAGETPILITSTLDSHLKNHVLVNLSNNIPDAFERFSKIVEIIDLQDDVKRPGRERFRFYRAQGCVLESHDLSKEIQ